MFQDITHLISKLQRIHGLRHLKDTFQSILFNIRRFLFWLLHWTAVSFYLVVFTQSPARPCIAPAHCLRGQIWLVNSPRGLFYKPITIVVLFQSWIGKKLSRSKLSGLSAESVIKLKHQNMTKKNNLKLLLKWTKIIQKILFLFFKCHSPWTLWRFVIKWVNYFSDNLNDFAQVFVIQNILSLHGGLHCMVNAWQ